jgi:hypothetical protein
MAMLGMRGTGNWETDERPKSWREGILKLYPNGKMPLTGIMSRTKNEKVTDPEFNWWTQSLASQAADVTEVYTDAALSSAYTTGGAAGDTLYVKLAAADVVQFREGHQVLLMNTDNYADSTNAKVTATVTNGANSYVAVKLLEDDPTTTGIADCDRILIIGSVNPEGGYMPVAVSYEPTKHYNYTQIFRTSLSVTRTARQTKLRTGDVYKRLKAEALELHGIEMEKAILWGVMSEGTGDNGKPERTTRGLINGIINNSGNVSNYVTESDWSGQSWLQGGEEWLDTQLEQLFRYGSDEKLAVCGSGVILEINKLIKEYGNYEFDYKTMDYGIRVWNWHTPFGSIKCLTHPLFSYEATHRYTMFIYEPKDVMTRYIQDTTFYPDPPKQNTGRGRIDGTDEEFLTELGIEHHHYEKCAFYVGFGSTNTA